MHLPPSKGAPRILHETYSSAVSANWDCRRSCTPAKLYTAYSVKLSCSYMKLDEVTSNSLNIWWISDVIGVNSHRYE